MASGPYSTAADWRLLEIETYHRGRNKDRTDDLTASFITNVSAMPGKTVERMAVKFSDCVFAMSRVEFTAAPVTKHALVYTTVRNERFLTFIFAGNTRDQVEKMAASMNTLKFVAQPAH
jgi:hypothetical protein